MDAEKLKAVLEEFVRDVNESGGVFTDADGRVCPRADPGWVDLGATYLKACTVLGLAPQYDEGENLLDEEEKDDAHEAGG
jgi:hypothetical protein